MNDCYVGLDTTIANLSKLSETLNSFHKDIKLSMEQHDLTLTFLDILIEKTQKPTKFR